VCTGRWTLVLVERLARGDGICLGGGRDWDTRDGGDFITLFPIGFSIDHASPIGRIEYFFKRMSNQ
jgi:hypothetical protein